MTTSARKIAVTDANVLINLLHVGRLGLCGELPGYEFVVPDHVREEIRDHRQRAMLEEALDRGELHIQSITELPSIRLYAELTGFLGRGESACLALAVAHGWLIASDERGRFRREAQNRIGAHRILGTKDLYLFAIGAGLLSVDEADADKAALEGYRFRMDFESFRELVT